jgi:hypothetical protein
MPASVIYQERLHVPLRWWVQATMLLATLWLALIVALPAWLAWAGSAAAFAGVYGILGWLGAARVEVRDGALHAGPATVPLSRIGGAEALDKEDRKSVV